MFEIDSQVFKLATGTKITLSNGVVLSIDNYIGSKKPIYNVSYIIKDKKLKRTLKINKDIFI